MNLAPIILATLAISAFAAVPLKLPQDHDVDAFLSSVADVQAEERVKTSLPPPEISVRLTSYPSGNLEVKKDESWYPVCGYWFWNVESDGARAACEQLGYADGRIKAHSPPTLSADAVFVGECDRGQVPGLNNFGSGHCKDPRGLSGCEPGSIGTCDCVAGQAAAAEVTCMGVRGYGPKYGQAGYFASSVQGSNADAMGCAEQCDAKHWCLGFSHAQTDPAVEAECHLAESVASLTTTDSDTSYIKDAAPGYSQEPTRGYWAGYPDAKRVDNGDANACAEQCNADSTCLGFFHAQSDQNLALEGECYLATHLDEYSAGSSIDTSFRRVDFTTASPTAPPTPPTPPPTTASPTLPTPSPDGSCHSIYDGWDDAKCESTCNVATCGEKAIEKCDKKCSSSCACFGATATPTTATPTTADYHPDCADCSGRQRASTEGDDCQNSDGESCAGKSFCYRRDGELASDAAACDKYWGEVVGGGDTRFECEMKDNSCEVVTPCCAGTATTAPATTATN